MNKNINTLTRLNKYDSLFIENNIFIKKDKRYLKCYRPVYEQIDTIIEIIKSTFNNELLIIHISKINNIDTEARLLRLRKAYSGVSNMLYYYNKYTNYGNKITNLIKYLDTQISNIDNINIEKLQLSQTIPNSIEYFSDSSETSDTDSICDETEYDEELNRSMYENIKNSIYQSSNNIKVIIIQVVTSFINAVKSLFYFY
tara:strand:- start:204 stop:803 length:600 start_codon:yes stop_codon:yes gene_type:complete